MTMLCAISGEAPTIPVASAKSGTVFEKRLIEAYIAEHGKDPVTGEELTTADLIELKSSNTIRPRPPTLTSIPALLATFQNEWDALALETHALRQQLAQTRQELSTALYQHDAATRVIARLIKERDEARTALSQVTVGAGAGAGGDQMDVDTQEVPEVIQQRIDETKKELSSGRKKRQVPADWATAETISTFKPVSTSEPLYPGAKSLALDATGDLALLGGADGITGVYSLSQQQVLNPLKGDDGAITDVAWAGKRAITASAGGVVRIWDSGESQAMKTHAGSVTAIAVHPSGSLLGSVGIDKSYVLSDLVSAKSVTQVYDDHSFTSAAFQPDGHLFAAGTQSAVKIYDVRSSSIAGAFEPLPGAVTSLDFSENGFWLALSVANQNSVEIWDLRKLAQIKALDTGSRVDHVKWDYSAQFLSTAGPSGISVQQYTKATKSWSEPLRAAVPAVATAWSPRASGLVTLNKDGVITVLGSA
ncbi:putative cell cycle control protein [Ascodesmis nigricans]|uniref:Pre-mRNA-processing factor 19 n=1 Tax=Ascodesmis nigricans TaxID=341454 RepID=A0A4V3SJ84_9PEZI|nr:putative cell cycle control protein [Ascodesmis nigricans]